jgi:phage tail-like protein
MRNDPLRNFRFRLEIDGGDKAQFSEVTGFDISTDAIDYREGHEETHVRKLPGLTKFGNITLKRGITDSMYLYDWYKQLIAGNVKRVPVAISVLDEKGNEAARFEISNAWPSKYDPMDLNAKGNDVSIETLELTNVGVVRVK